MGQHRKKTPAECVYATFGGVRATARALGMTAGPVSRWNRPVWAGGTGGLIPTAQVHRIIRAARKLGKPINAEDLIHGR